MGLPLDEAAQRLPERMPLPETNFFAIVIAIQSRTGGSLSEALANLSDVLRERQKMKAKARAMSGEAKSSAYIIGGLADHRRRAPVRDQSPVHLASLHHPDRQTCACRLRGLDAVRGSGDAQDDQLRGVRGPMFVQDHSREWRPYRRLHGGDVDFSRIARGLLVLSRSGRHRGAHAPDGGRAHCRANSRTHEAQRRRSHR